MYEDEGKGVLTVPYDIYLFMQYVTYCTVRYILYGDEAVTMSTVYIRQCTDTRTHGHSVRALLGLPRTTVGTTAVD